ncbi:uncharacterized protein C11orf52 homolog [Protopterus annectens]|uniref:uncharacterized protein C11orf52 homolog n=1 Tax=Protopterus annectens TaxID=7888 RepID=UPI001CFB2619|nr:uncharacterized protein C11orf52 homolog [Protopterus annectens]
MGNYACGLGSLVERTPKPPKRRPKDSLARGHMKHAKKDMPYELVHTYDTVADFPVYATVNKKKVEDTVQYSDVRILRVPQRNTVQVKEHRKQNETEYATLAFPAPAMHYDSKNGTLV